jgi:uncharacterized protein YndB with AHSA1/START domain
MDRGQIDMSGNRVPRRLPIRFRNRVRVDRPVAEVFSFLSDPRNIPLWSLRVEAVELETEEPIGEGTRFLQVRERDSQRLEISEYSPHRRISYRTFGASSPAFSVRIDLEPSGDGTVVTRRVERATVKHGPLAWTLGQQLSNLAAEDLGTLKRILDQREDTRQAFRNEDGADFSTRRTDKKTESGTTGPRDPKGGMDSSGQPETTEPGAPTVSFRNSVRVDRPVEEVFSLVSDFGKIPLWNPNVRSVDKLTQGPIAVGSRYRQRRASDEQRFEITRLNPPRLVAIRTLPGSRPSFNMTFSFESDCKGTVVTVVHGRWAFKDKRLRKLARLLQPKAERASAEALLGMKQLLETGSTTPQDGREVKHEEGEHEGR